MSMKVSQLYYYPVKSCSGISLRSANIGRMGIRFDRQWMVVDENGMFVAQRGDGPHGIGIKAMCLIETSIQGESLCLTAPKMPMIEMPVSGMENESGNTKAVNVRIWKNDCVAVDQGNEAAEWFTEFLSRERRGKYRLVRMADNGVRKAKHGGGDLAFADGNAFLIISQSSLDDLNARMPEPLPMNRFRPNIVITGSLSYDEDRMVRIRIGGIEFMGAKLCVRCPITTINQFNAERGKEPLTTLSKYRRTEKGVVFGKYFNHSGNGTISLGDEVHVLSY